MKNGPGGGGVFNETTPPGGAGHGSYGGGAFKTTTFPPFKVSRFGYPYHAGDGYHLIGGSSGKLRLDDKSLGAAYLLQTYMLPFVQQSHCDLILYTFMQRS